MTSVEERVKRIIADILGLDEKEVTPDLNFVEDIGIESLDKVEMTAAMEEEFDIEIPDEEAERNLTVGQTIDYIERKLKEKSTSP
jgi:acyl carrier protein